jgi:PIN domain nuclease of toxin-antitoxin system
MEGSRALRSAARSAIADPENEVVFGIASLWELTIKSALGKLRFPADPEAILDSEGYGVLPISLAHLRELAALPLLHRDPFDRMLIAQAHVDGLAIITADRAFSLYGPALVRKGA